MPTPIYRLEPGRAIYAGRTCLCNIGRVEGQSPANTDQFAHTIVAALNAHKLVEAYLNPDDESLSIDEARLMIANRIEEDLAGSAGS